MGTIVTRVSQLFDVPEARIKSFGKEPEEGVKAKSVAACWAVKELGMAGTEVGNTLSLTQSAVSRASEGARRLSENSAFPLLAMELHNFMGGPYFSPRVENIQIQRSYSTSNNMLVWPVPSFAYFTDRLNAGGDQPIEDRKLFAMKYRLVVIFFFASQ